MKSLEDIVAEIVREIAKCAIFVREYVGSGFGGSNVGNYFFICLTMFLARVLTQFTTKDEEKIAEFTTVFGKLQQSLGNPLAVYTIYGCRADSSAEFTGMKLVRLVHS
jgi:hypothetical protein